MSSKLHAIAWQGDRRCVLVTNRAFSGGAGAQQDRDAVGVIVGHGEVLPAVAIKIAHGNERRPAADAKVSGAAETAGAISQQDRHVRRIKVSDGKVLLAVAIEIADCYRVRMGPTPKLVAALKSPVPLPRKIDTSLEAALATARSCRPSPLKSPTVT